MNGPSVVSSLRKMNLDVKVTGFSEVDQMLQNSKKIPEEVLVELAAFTIQEVVADTPVDTGLLKYNWNPRGNALSYAKSRPIKRVNDTLSITFYNPTFYASWVEFGHYTADKETWIEGQYTTTRAVERAEMLAGGIMQTEVNKRLDKYFNLRGGKWDIARTTRYK